MSLPVLEKANDTEWLGHCAQSRDGALMALEHDRLRGLVGIPDAHFPIVVPGDDVRRRHNRQGRDPFAACLPERPQLLARL